MKEEIAKENDFLTELLNLEEAPQHQTASKKSIGKLGESASPGGKLNPTTSLDI